MYHDTTESLKNMTKKQIKVLSPTAILGYGFPEKSLKEGMERKPDVIGVDAGSTDPGPYYLGSGKSFTNRKAVKRDLRFMIIAGVKNKIPVIVGTAGGSGAKPHLDWCCKIVQEIIKEEKLKLKLGIISADIPQKQVLKAYSERKIKPLPFAPKLSATAIKDSKNIVAQMGMEPIIKALKKGCNVILAGRCYDPAVFAAYPVYMGFDKGLAMHMGKILECAAIASTPGSGSDCAIGTLKKDSFILETLSSARKFTPHSTAAHTLYEKSDPYHLPGPGGMINLEECSFKQLKSGTVEVKGSRYIESKKYTIKLEGARKSGYRSISIAGTRDPIMIRQIDSILQTVEKQVRTSMKSSNIKGDINFHVYGKNAVMKNSEPVKKTKAHELGILIEATASSQDDASALCSITRSTLLHYGYPGRISTAGNLAFPFSPSDGDMGEVYEFSLYHIMEIKDQKLFKLKVKEFK